MNKDKKVERTDPPGKARSRKDPALHLVQQSKPGEASKIKRKETRTPSNNRTSGCNHKGPRRDGFQETLEKKQVRHQEPQMTEIRHGADESQHPERSKARSNEKKASSKAQTEEYFMRDGNREGAGLSGPD